MPPEEHEEESVGPLVDGIRVVDKPRLALVRTNPVAIVILLSGSILLASCIAFALTHFKGAQEAVQTVIPEHEPTLPPIANTPRYLTVPGTNVRVLLPTEWRESRGGDTLPNGVVLPRVTLTHPDTTCRIAYASIETTTLKDAYRSNAERTDVIRDARFVGRIERAVPLANVSGDNGTSSASHLGEVAFAYQPLFYDNGSTDATRDAWVLYSLSDDTIDSQCTDGLLEIVRSYTPYFEPVVLTRDMAGVLSVEDYTDIAPEVGTVLLWHDTGPARLVTTLDTGMINKPTVIGDTLYYVGTEGLLKGYRLIDTLPPQVVPLPLDAEASVHDFRVTSGTVEYLAGSWCAQTPDTCDLTHDTFNLTTLETIVLEEHATSPLLVLEQPPVHESLQLSNSGFTAGTGHVPGIVNARIPIALAP